MGHLHHPFSMFVPEQTSNCSEVSFFNVFFLTLQGSSKKTIWERWQTWWFWGNSNSLINSRIVWGGNIMMALAIVSSKVLLHWQIPKLKVEGKKWTGLISQSFANFPYIKHALLYQISWWSISFWCVAGVMAFFPNSRFNKKSKYNYYIYIYI